MFGSEMMESLDLELRTLTASQDDAQRSCSIMAEGEDSVSDLKCAE